MDSSVGSYASLTEMLIRHADDDSEDTDSSGSMPGLEPRCKLDDDSSLSSSDTVTSEPNGRKLVNERDCWDIEGGIDQKGADAQLPGGIGDSEDTDSSGSMPGLEPRCKLDDDSSLSSSDTVTSEPNGRKLVNERDCWDVEGGIDQKGADAQLPGGIGDDSSVDTGSDSSGSTMPGLVERIGMVQTRSVGVATLSERLEGSKKNGNIEKKGRVGIDIALWKNGVEKQDVANEASNRRGGRANEKYEWDLGMLVTSIAGLEKYK
jgi:hypothetical protein